MAVDLDGVVWRGDEPLPGVPEALREVVRRGLALCYVTNNSTAHREAVVKRLLGLGLPAEPERVLTSGFVAARWLKERLAPGSVVMVVGEEGLLRELREAGLDAQHVSAWSAEQAAISEEGSVSGFNTPPDAVVVGMDRSFSYASLAAAQRALLGGALFVATNPDATFPTPAGLKPGAGSLVAAVATAAQREPVFMGKPGPALAEILASVTRIPAAQTLFVGDRLETDIAMGRQVGMVTALVLTGVTSREDLERARRGAGAPETKPTALRPVMPDYVLKDLSELPSLLDELTSES